MSEPLFKDEIGAFVFIATHEIDIRNTVILPEVAQLTAAIVEAHKMWADKKIDENGYRYTVSATIAAAVCVGRHGR